MELLRGVGGFFKLIVMCGFVVWLSLCLCTCVFMFVVGVVGVGSVGYEDCEKGDGVEGDGSGDFGRRMCGVKHSEVFQMHFWLMCSLCF
jgi:hypothetical protein